MGDFENRLLCLAYGLALVRIDKRGKLGHGSFKLLRWSVYLGGEGKETNDAGSQGNQSVDPTSE